MDCWTPKIDKAQEIGAHADGAGVIGMSQWNAQNGRNLCLAAGNQLYRGEAHPGRVDVGCGGIREEAQLDQHPLLVGDQGAGRKPNSSDQERGKREVPTGQRPPPD